MAVTRFTLPAKHHRIMAHLMATAGHLRAAKELERAAGRPGLTAELTEGEFEALYDLVPWGTDIIDELDRAKFALELAKLEEGRRLRGPVLGMAPSSFLAREAKRRKR